MKNIIRIIAGGVIFFLIVLYSFRPVTGDEPMTSVKQGGDEQYEVCSGSLSMPIPDNSPTGGANHSMDIPFEVQISDLDVFLDITHTWVGDLIIGIVHVGYGPRMIIFDQPGYPSQPSGCSGNDIRNYADDEAVPTFENDCTSGPNPTQAYLSGQSYQPGDPPGNVLQFFDGQPFEGTWTITVFDVFSGDIGTLNEWCLRATLPALHKMYMSASFSIDSFPVVGP